MSAALHVAALTGRHLIRLRRSPGRLVGIVLNPLVMLLAFGVLFRDVLAVPAGIDHVFAGAAVQVGLASLGPTAIGMAEDVRGGLVDRFRSVPVAKVSVLAGHTLADLVSVAAGLVAVTAAGLVLGWRPHGSPLALLGGFALVLAFGYVMVWLGVLLGLTVRALPTVDTVAALALVVFSFLSTAFVPAQGLPSWLRPVAEWNPVSVVVDACRDLWGGGTGHVGAAVAVLAAVLLVTVPCAVRAFGRESRS
jgi:ABC-2 type transport system permease protein